MGNRTADGILLAERRDHLIAEIEQFRVDIQSWNEQHPEWAPIQWDPDGELQRELDWLKRWQTEAKRKSEQHDRLQT